MQSRWKESADALLTPGMRRLALQDALRLGALLLFTILLATLTGFYFRSYEQHQQAVAARWLERGQSSLAAGQPQVALDAAGFLEASNHPVEALTIYRGVLALQPDSPEALYGAGRAAFATGHLRYASDCLAHFVALYPDAPRAPMARALLADASQTLREAESGQ